MTEYLDTLEPDATIVSILDDIYSDARGLAGRAEALLVAAHGPDSGLTTIPGMALQMDQVSSRAPHGEDLSTERLFTDTDLGRRVLLSVSATEGYTTIQQRAVQAPRGGEVGGYVLAVSQTGLIECVLQAGDPADEAEPVGRDLLPPWRFVSELPDDTRDRLRAVTSSLRGNMAAVELIMEGVDPEEALAAVSHAAAA